MAKQGHPTDRIARRFALGYAAVDGWRYLERHKHRFLAADQLREIACDAAVILEPVGKNTVSAVAVKSDNPFIHPG